MLHFTSENIEWIQLLLDDAITRAKDDGKVEKITQMKEKVTALFKEELKITVTQKQIESIEEVLKDLEQITDAYSKQTDISVVEEYDQTKKQMSTKLQYLATYKDILLDEANYIEDVLKKEIRIRMVMEIKNTEGVSFTQADKMVEADPRYSVLRSQVQFVKNIANKVKTRYDFYMKFWQMVFQSVSTASKEQYASRNNNDK